MVHTVAKKPRPGYPLAAYTTPTAKTLSLEHTQPTTSAQTFRASEVNSECYDTFEINKVDLVILTETWLILNVLNTEIDLHDMKIYRYNRTGQFKGGPALYISSTIKSFQVSDPFMLVPGS